MIFETANNPDGQIRVRIHDEEGGTVDLAMAITVDDAKSIVQLMTHQIASIEARQSQLQPFEVAFFQATFGTVHFVRTDPATHGYDVGTVQRGPWGPSEYVATVMARTPEEATSLGYALVRDELQGIAPVYMPAGLKRATV